MLKILAKLELFLIFLSKIKTLKMLYLISEIPLTRILIPIHVALIKYLPNKNFMGKNVQFSSLLQVTVQGS